MKKIVLTLLILTLLSGCSSNHSDEQFTGFDIISEVTTEYKVGEVVRGDIRQEIPVGSIVVFPTETVTIRFWEDIILKEVYVGYGEIIDKGEIIAEVDTSVIDEEIMYQEFEIDKATALYEDMVRNGTDSYELEIQALEIEILKTELAKMEEKKASYTIYAEEDCYISTGSVMGGKVVPAGESLFTLTLLTDFGLKSLNEISLTKYPHIQVGDTLEVTYSNKSFRAEISYMSINDENDAYLFFEPLEEVDFGKKRIYEVLMTGLIDSLVVEDVLYIPIGAVKDNLKKYVELYNGDMKRVRYINIGSSGYDSNGMMVVQVMGGLKEGEQVIIGEINPTE
jgi:hypothetical protein